MGIVLLLLFPLHLLLLFHLLRLLLIFRMSFFSFFVRLRNFQFSSVSCAMRYIMLYLLGSESSATWNNGSEASFCAVVAIAAGAL